MNVLNLKSESSITSKPRLKLYYKYGFSIYVFQNGDVINYIYYIPEGNKPNVDAI